MEKKILLEDVAIDNNVPLKVTIELLTKCNWRCKHCYIPNHNNNGINFEDLRNLLYELRDLGTLEVTFTGGEIFLRKDIFEIIELARSLHFRVNLLSNASLLDEEKIIKLSKLNIRIFSTTVFSMEDSVHDYITNSRGALKKTLDNILLMKKYNIPIKIKTPIMKYNTFDYRKIKEFCEYNNFKFQADTAITIKNDGDVSPISLRVKNEDLKTVISEINVDKDKKYTFDLDREACRSILYNLHITCEGDVYPCVSFVYKVGNIFENSITEIWNNSVSLQKVKKIKNKDLSECIKCDLKEFCSRCPGGALIEKNDLFGCDEYNKISAIALKSSLKL